MKGRDAHLALAGDAVTAEAFGLRRLMSCDSVRRNLKAIPEKEGLEWIWNENLRLAEPLLDQDYILDLDPTVKPVYGHQEGAEFGHNPQKPGRPSHCYHTLWGGASPRRREGKIAVASTFEIRYTVRRFRWRE